MWFANLSEFSMNMDVLDEKNMIGEHLKLTENQINNYRIRKVCYLWNWFKEKHVFLIWEFDTSIKWTKYKICFTIIKFI